MLLGRAPSQCHTYSSCREGRWENILSLTSEKVPLTRLLQKRDATHQAGPPRIPSPPSIRPGAAQPRTHREPRPAGRLRGAPAAPTHSADSRQQLQGGPQRGGLRGAAGSGGSASSAHRAGSSRSGTAIPAPPLPARRSPPPPEP